MDSLPDDVILHIASLVEYPTKIDPIVSLFAINKRFRSIFHKYKPTILHNLANNLANSDEDIKKIVIGPPNEYIVELAAYSNKLSKLLDNKIIRLPIYADVQNVSLLNYSARYRYCKINLLHHNNIPNKYEFITLMLLFHDPLYEVVGSCDSSRDDWKFNFKLLGMYYFRHKFSEKEIDVIKFILTHYSYTKKELNELNHMLQIYNRQYLIKLVSKHTA
jgi:hypothetical protein